MIDIYTLLWIILIICVIILLYLKQCVQSKKITIGGSTDPIYYKEINQNYILIFITNPNGKQIEEITDIDNKVIKYFYENVYKTDFDSPEINNLNAPSKYQNDRILIKIIYFFYLRSMTTKDHYPEFITGDTKFKKFYNYLHHKLFYDLPEGAVLDRLNKKYYEITNLLNHQIESILDEIPIDGFIYTSKNINMDDFSMIRSALQIKESPKTIIALSVSQLKPSLDINIDVPDIDNSYVKSSEFCSIM